MLLVKLLNCGEKKKCTVGATFLRSQKNTRIKSVLGILQPGGHWCFSQTLSITLLLGIYQRK